MKKSYETPVVEKIEFDYVETVKANSTGWCGGCGSGYTGYNAGNNYTLDQHTSVHPDYGQTVYRDSNNGYTCMNSLAPDNDCGFAQGNNHHTNNVGNFLCN